MKRFIIKLLKTTLLFIISTLIIYITLTLTELYSWCNKNNIPVFETKFDEYKYASEHLDPKEIQALGDTIDTLKSLSEKEQNNISQETGNSAHSLDDGHNHVPGDFFNPLGYAIWRFYASTINSISVRHINISILLGISISIGYMIIDMKKLKNMLKFIIGYLSIIIIMPIVYTYIYTHRLFSISEMYFRIIPSYFYIVYTIIFILMYLLYNKKRNEIKE